MKIDRLSIIGLGLMGGSVALAARRVLRSCEIVGYDRAAAARQFAVKRRVVDRVAPSPRHAVDGADLILLAVPITPARKILSEIARYVPEHASVTDVCSTKRSVMSTAGKLPSLSRCFVGSHPMAGSAQKGIEHADGTIFRKSLCILTTGKATDPVAVRFVESFWQKLGMRTTRLPAGRHDALMALASHLPQVVASVLMAVQSSDSVAVAGKGLLDTTRLAASDGPLWADILIDNHTAVAGAIAEFGNTLTQLRSAIRRRDRAQIIRIFKIAKATRQTVEHR